MTTLYLLMLIGGCLVALGLVAGLYSSRLGFSHLLVFLCVGMLAGVDGPLGLPFDDYKLAFGVGNLALALILLDGGLRTPAKTLRAGLLPASLLATVGVALTSAIAGAAAMWALDLDWRHGLLLGAVIASTDAAAVFAQLGGDRAALPHRLSATIEVESGLNDPMAVFLVLSLIALIKAPDSGGADLLALFAHHAGWGAAIGLGAGLLLAWGLHRLPLDEHRQGLTALLLAAAGLVVFALAGLVDASAFVAVYLFGLVLAQRARRTVRAALPALDGYTWLAQAGLFLLLGLLVTPHDLLRLAGPALAVAAALMLVARPLAVVLCLAPLRFPWREQLMVAAVGLRGAVPIVLAVYPVMAGIEGAYRFFDVAFVVVLSSLLLQGPALGALARALGLNGSSKGG
ncbi:potassium/proton antiporter [Aquincola sp. S2]|uniref:Potassium/proton antiporter n=1 Tax=Pseudaquabacterium terrae TaxID=2732868 RepID=A0ABX2EHP2_9BURK|nr:potassium/proton antiporter [Aquabacterium terrae]NRF68128.1 potassium/proton antiporter [Aquabacterium terrae]